MHPCPLWLFCSLVTPTHFRIPEHEMLPEVQLDISIIGHHVLKPTSSITGFPKKMTLLQWLKHTAFSHLSSTSVQNLLKSAYRRPFRCPTFVNLRDVYVSSHAALETVLGPVFCVLGGKQGARCLWLVSKDSWAQGLPLKLSLLPTHCLVPLYLHLGGHLPDPDSLDPCYLCVFSHLQHDLDWCFHLLKTTRTFTGKLSLASFQVIIAIYSVS